MILHRRRKMLMNRITCRIMSSHYRRAARRTHRIEHIELPKISALARQPVKAGRFEPRMSVTRQIAPTPIVSEDENDIRLSQLRRVSRL